MNSTSQAASRCEPKKRDRRPSRCGECRRRITAKMTTETRTSTRRESSRKPSQAAGPDERDVEVPVEQRPVRLDDGQHEQEEAPEREHVRDARHGPLQQLPLPEHLDDLGADTRSRRRTVRPGSTGWPLPTQPDQVCTRRPASQNATAVMSRPTTSRTVTCPRSGRLCYRRSGSSRVLDLGDQRRQHRVQVADDAEVGDREDRRLRRPC